MLTKDTCGIEREEERGGRGGVHHSYVSILLFDVCCFWNNFSDLLFSVVFSLFHRDEQT